jgi:hypothetical protein
MSHPCSFEPCFDALGDETTRRSLALEAVERRTADRRTAWLGFGRLRALCRHDHGTDADGSIPNLVFIRLSLRREVILNND